ncbi:MAG: hypothetical protein K1X56_00210 [Flavobacteriales bacterium]|nr:hypothetical protein [Flavobacteriales bacterium]
MVNKTALLFILFAWSEIQAQQLEPDSTYSIPDNLKETSGLAHFGPHFISINDSGNPNLVIEMDHQGKFVKTYTIEKSKNSDWEDICTDPQNNIYIGDFGNNGNKRTNLCIYKFQLGTERIYADKIDFKYSDQKSFPPAESNKNFDCEAFFWHNGKLFLFSKNNESPFSGYTKLYELSDKPGVKEAKLLDSLYLGKGGFFEHAVTAASIDRRTGMVALLTYQHLYLLYDYEGDDFFSGKMLHFPMGILRQREAILFDDKGDLWGTEEKRMAIGGNLYHYPLVKWLNGEKEYNDKSISDPMFKSDGEKGGVVISLSFRTDLPGNYSAEIRGGQEGTFQMYQKIGIKDKKNEGKEILFGKINVPPDAVPSNSVICIYRNNQVIFMRSLKKIIK